MGKNNKKNQLDESNIKPEIAVDKKNTEESAEKDTKKKSAKTYGSEAKKSASGEQQNDLEENTGSKTDKDEQDSKTTADIGSSGSSDAGDTDKTVDNGTSETVERDPVSVLKEEISAERDRYLRLAAEYDNFRKRSMKELQTVYSDSRADTVTKLLPVYDNLERALKMECSDEPFYKGVEMTMTQLTEILENMGVKLIDAMGKPFDPNTHNAVVTIENPELGDKIVADEIQKGFMLGDKVIRFSSVVVAN